MVDRGLILRKLADLDVYVRQLGEYRGVTADRYRDDWRTQRVIDRTLQIAIEACLDIANHLIADRQLRAPSTYADTFQILAEAGLLSPSLLKRMEGIAGFRNLLVHEYARLDPGRVVLLVNERLDDFAEFRQAILAAI